MKSRFKFAAMPVVVVVMASPLLADCGALKGIASGNLEIPDCSSEFKSGDFSGIKADAGVKGFLNAANKFDKAVDKMEADLIKSCTDLGKAIGMKDDELKSDGKGGEGAKKVCEAVGAKVASMIKANADAQIGVEIVAPKCGADVDEMMKCFGDCGSPIKPGELKADCQGGEVSGTCGGDCKGSCSVEAGGDCKGTCGGGCTGKCDANYSGSCTGKCDGKCDGKDNHGKCAGTCEGKCDATAGGNCGGTCEGKCDASCEVKGAASCKGECHGDCSAEVTAPHCSGEFKPPSVSIDCQAKCAAAGAASLKCFPPQVNITVKGKSNTDVVTLVNALRKTLPKIVEIELGSAKSLGKAGVGLVTQVKGAVTGAKDAGIKALACLTQAATETAGASAAIDLNVKASVSVTASVGVK